MNITPNNFLNVITILINEVFGSLFLFVLLGLIAITYICLTNNIPVKTTIAINAFFALLTITIYYNQLLLALAVLLIAAGAYGAYNMYLARQNN